MNTTCKVCATWAAAWRHQADVNRKGYMEARRCRDKAGAANYDRWRKQSEERARQWASGHFHDATCVAFAKREGSADA